MSSQSPISRRGLLGAATALGAGGLLCAPTPTLAWGRPGPARAPPSARVQHAQIAAAHNPDHVITGADAIRETFTSLLEAKHTFDREVTEAVARFPDGVTIDDLFTYLRGQQGVVAQIPQFPQRATFNKLTLFHFCRQHFTETQGSDGRPAFK